MTNRLIDFLRCALPFVLTLALWRLAGPWLNPGGMLALIPIFYCTFIRPVPFFSLFAAVMCFLIDYKSGTLLYWTSVFCACYAVYKIQTVVDLGAMPRRALSAFAILFGASVLVITLPHIMHGYNFLRMMWTILWECAMYIPLTFILQRATHD
ncbi:hypothetical protein HDR61_02515 [bacterium]|nr:hypothetical protein [bacterium]